MNVWLKKIFINVMSLSIAFIAIELLVRLFIGHTFKKDSNITDCYKHFVNFNTEIGYKNVATDMFCRIYNAKDKNDYKEYKITHSEDGSRLTDNIISSKNYSHKVHFYGCSITWGHGVNNNETIPSHIGSISNTFEVKNFGVGGYSTLQSLLLFKENISRGETPDLVILNYGSFHDSRNVMDKDWIDAWYFMIYSSNVDLKDIKSFKLPFAKVKKDELEINYLNIDELKISKFRLYSSLINNLYLLSKKAERDSKSDYVSLKIIEAFNKLCMKNNITLVVAGVFNDEKTKLMVKRLNEKGIYSIDVSLDHTDNRFNLMPYDPHFNSYANKIMAERINNYIRNTIHL